MSDKLRTEITKLGSKYFHNSQGPFLPTNNRTMNSHRSGVQQIINSHRSGVQQIINEKNSLAVFINCDNHSLNLVSVHAGHSDDPFLWNHCIIVQLLFHTAIG